MIGSKPKSRRTHSRLARVQITEDAQPMIFFAGARGRKRLARADFPFSAGARRAFRAPLWIVQTLVRQPRLRLARPLAQRLTK